MRTYYRLFDFRAKTGQDARQFFVLWFWPFSVPKCTFLGVKLEPFRTLKVQKRLAQEVLRTHTTAYLIVGLEQDRTLAIFWGASSVVMPTTASGIWLKKC